MRGRKGEGKKYEILLVESVSQVRDRVPLQVSHHPSLDNFQQPIPPGAPAGGDMAKKRKTSVSTAPTEMNRLRGREMHDAGRAHDACCRRSSVCMGSTAIAAACGVVVSMCAVASE